jgi:hypothetical protein
VKCVRWVKRGRFERSLVIVLTSESNIPTVRHLRYSFLFLVGSLILKNRNIVDFGCNLGRERVRIRGHQETGTHTVVIYAQDIKKVDG